MTEGTCRSVTTARCRDLWLLRIVLGCAWFLFELQSMLCLDGRRGQLPINACLASAAKKGTLVILLLMTLVVPGNAAPQAPLQPRLLVDDPAIEAVWPAFSPRGDTIVYCRKQAGRWELVLIPVGGGQSKRLRAEATVFDQTRPTWSAQSGLIAFTGVSPDGGSELWTVRADGSGLSRLSVPGMSRATFYPSWFRHRNALVFVDFGESGIGIVKEVDVERGAIRSLTDPIHMFAEKPDVAPDGRAVVFAGQANHGQAYDQTVNTIWIVEEGRKPRELVRGQGRAPAWSPNGDWITFESNRGNAEGLYAIYGVPRCGGTPLRLTPFILDAQHPAWSPDARHIAMDVRLTAGSRGIAVLEVFQSLSGNSR
jgi:Tol biopolymer transport system component